MNNCIQCHGETGRGDGPLAASLPIPPANLYDHIPFHPDQFFFGVISVGLSGVMPAFEDVISEDDRWNILNFLRDQFGDPAPVTQ
jgi:putative copper resistance protein D